MITKNISISYDGADESFIEAFFKKMKIKVKPITKVEDDSILSVEEFKTNFRRSVSQMKAHQRGELVLPTWEEMMSEIEDHETVVEK